MEVSSKNHACLAETQLASKHAKLYTGARDVAAIQL